MPDAAPPVRVRTPSIRTSQRQALCRTMLPRQRFTTLVSGTILLLLPACGSDRPAEPPIVDSIFATGFPSDEDTLSQGGKWQHHDSLLTVCKVSAGTAFGTQTGNNGYDDSNAFLTGFGTDYEVEARVWINSNLTGPGNREVEILLRWDDTGPVRSTAFGDTRATGYEINAQHAGAYLQLGRFKGENLAQVYNFATPPKTGDRFRARIEGQHIRVWWNDSLQIDYTDSNLLYRITSGNPGIGFYVSGGAPNTDFGFDSVTVRPLKPN